MTNGVLTTAQVAKRLKCSLKTVQRMAADGRLNPRDKWPGQTGGYLFDETDVEQLQAGGPARERERA